MEKISLHDEILPPLVKSPLFSLLLPFIFSISIICCLNSLSVILNNLFTTLAKLKSLGKFQRLFRRCVSAKPLVYFYITNETNTRHFEKVSSHWETCLFIFHSSRPISFEFSIALLLSTHTLYPLTEFSTTLSSLNFTVHVSDYMPSAQKQSGERWTNRILISTLLAINV